MKRLATALFGIALLALALCAAPVLGAEGVEAVAPAPAAVTEAKALSPAESILLEAAQRHEAEAAAQAKAKADSDAEAEAKAEAEAIAQANADAEAAAQAHAQAEAEAAAQAEAEGSSDAEALARSQMGAEADADANIDSDAVSEMVAAAEADQTTDANSQAAVESSSNVDAEAFASGELDQGFESAMQGEVYADNEAVQQTYTQVEGGLEAEAESQAEFEAQNESEMEGESESEADAEGESESDSEAEEEQAFFEAAVEAAEERLIARNPALLEVQSESDSDADAEQTDDAALVSKGETVVVKIPNPVMKGKFLKVRVPMPEKGRSLLQAHSQTTRRRRHRRRRNKQAKKAAKAQRKAAKKARKAKKAAKGGKGDDREYVLGLYRSLLCREGEPAGVRGWVGALKNGQSREQVRKGFLDSPEYRGRKGKPCSKGKPSDRPFVLGLYRELLCREGEPAGVRGWVNALKNGQSREQVRKGFLDSPEYRGRKGKPCPKGKPGDRPFVLGLYRELLCREGEPAGVRNWVNALKNGKSRAQVRQGFLESPEYRSGKGKPCPSKKGKKGKKRCPKGKKGRKCREKRADRKAKRAAKKAKRAARKAKRAEKRKQRKAAKKKSKRSKKAKAKRKARKAARKAKKKVRKLARKAKRAARKAARKAKKALKKAKKAAKKLEKKLSPAEMLRKIRAEKAERARTRAASLRAKELPKGPLTTKWTTISVPDPKRPGHSKEVKVQVRVPAKPKKALTRSIVRRTLRVPDPNHPGRFISKEIEVTRHFKTLRQTVADPLNPGKMHVVDVKVEVPPPNRKPKAAIANANQVLEKHISKLESSIHRLKSRISAAKRKVVDSPVVEDGAPAPPDRQQVEMAQNLYKVLDATVMHKAGQIGQRYLNEAADMIVIADANHQAVADFNDKVNEEYLLPKDPW